MRNPKQKMQLILEQLQHPENPTTNVNKPNNKAIQQSDAAYEDNLKSK